MPVRKRGNTWQVDVRLLDGSRFRKTYPTEESARAAEVAMRPNPTQRAIARSAARASRSKSSDTVRFAKPSLGVSAHSPQPKSLKPTSLKCVPMLPKPRRR